MYAYCNNNPVNYADPTGMCTYVFSGCDFIKVDDCGEWDCIHSKYHKSNAYLANLILTHPNYSYQAGKDVDKDLKAVASGSADNADNISRDVLLLILSLYSAGQTFELTWIIRSGSAGHSAGKAFDLVKPNGVSHGDDKQYKDEWKAFIDVIDSITIGWENNYQIGVPNEDFYESNNFRVFTDFNSSGAHLHIEFN